MAKAKVRQRFCSSFSCDGGIQDIPSLVQNEKRAAGSTSWSWTRCWLNNCLTTGKLEAFVLYINKIQIMNGTPPAKKEGFFIGHGTAASLR